MSVLSEKERNKSDCALPVTRREKTNGNVKNKKIWRGLIKREHENHKKSDKARELCSVLFYTSCKPESVCVLSVVLLRTR